MNQDQPINKGDEKMYNASILDNETQGISVAEVSNGKIYRSNAVQFTGLEGSNKFDSYFRISHPNITILIDDCKEYKDRLTR